MKCLCESRHESEPSRISSYRSIIRNFRSSSSPLLLPVIWRVHERTPPRLRKRCHWEREGGRRGHVSILSSAISFQVSAGKEERWRRGGGVGRNEGVNSMLRNLIEYWINKANGDVGNSLNASDPLIKMSLRNGCFVLRIRIDSFALFFFFFMKRDTRYKSK